MASMRNGVLPQQRKRDLPEKSRERKNGMEVRINWTPVYYKQERICVILIQYFPALVLCRFVQPPIPPHVCSCNLFFALSASATKKEANIY